MEREERIWTIFKLEEREEQVSIELKHVKNLEQTTFNKFRTLMLQDKLDKIKREKEFVLAQPVTL
ncbi:MAG: hypothetical protein J6R83_00715 [Clostridia bacterium]|nr:hypothetical protein [Clostridia bacterium]